MNKSQGCGTRWPYVFEYFVLILNDRVHVHSIQPLNVRTFAKLVEICYILQLALLFNSYVALGMRCSDNTMFTLCV